jgi:hypothetical protein
MSDPIAFGASGAIEALCTVLLDIAKTSPSANINDVMAQVKSALDRNTKLTNALQTDTRMLQINLGQSKGYQVLVEGNATAYICCSLANQLPDQSWNISTHCSVVGWRNVANARTFRRPIRSLSCS